MRSQIRWTLVAALLVIALGAQGALATHERVSGSFVTSASSSGGCAWSPECTLFRSYPGQTCNPALAKPDGVTASIVDVGGKGGRTGVLTWTGVSWSPSDNLSASFFRTTCTDTTPRAISVSSSGGSLTIPAGAKWMVVTATALVNVRWQLVFNH